MKIYSLGVWILAATVAGVTCRFIEEDVDEMKKLLNRLSHQVMDITYSIEHRSRTQDSSGIKELRQDYAGTKPYHSTRKSKLAIHEHADYKFILGMGEVVAVLNGAEFATRHNDYKMDMPSTTSKEYQKTEPVPFPSVPQEVLAKGTVEEQEAEMREWFRAFRDEDSSVRDYRKYFRPVLCYLEGAWTLVGEYVDELYASGRHFLQAKTYDELSKKVRFSDYSGSKNNGENYAYLPTAIVGFTNDSKPIFAQFNYRIACHPLNRYIERSRLFVMDDLTTRLTYNITLENFAIRRNAGFRLNSVDSADFEEGQGRWHLLDEVMGEIPGKDNYGAVIRDAMFGLTARQFNDIDQPLNAAKYHRWFKCIYGGASAEPFRHRGYSDMNIFMAMTTNERIAPVTMDDRCKLDGSGKLFCKDWYQQRWSYAIPLEINYLTPIGTWNPYDLPYNATGEQESGRKGGCTQSSAFTMVTDSHFFQTPETFYSGATLGSEAADTSKKVACVKDRDGVLRRVKASGNVIRTPEISDVGSIRLRFPIAPETKDGNEIYKELAALKDLLFDSTFQYRKLKEDFIENNAWMMKKK